MHLEAAWKKAALPQTLAAHQGARVSPTPGPDRRLAGVLTPIGCPQKLEAGRTLFAEGDDADNVFEITEGMLKLYKLLTDGRRQITGFVSSGQLIGLVHDELYLYSAEALTDVKLRRYPRVQFNRLLDERPGLARQVLALGTQEVRMAQEHLLLLGRKNAVEKIASFVLLLQGLHSSVPASAKIDVPMTRCDIADFLGLTVETVSRTFTKLKRDGVIDLPTPSQIGLRNRDYLEELAAGALAA